jgi:hypothetical protein
VGWYNVGHHTDKITWRQDVGTTPSAVKQVLTLAVRSSKQSASSDILYSRWLLQLCLVRLACQRSCRYLSMSSSFCGHLPLVLASSEVLESSKTVSVLQYTLCFCSISALVACVLLAELKAQVEPLMIRLLARRIVSFNLWGASDAADLHSQCCGDMSTDICFFVQARVESPERVISKCGSP